MDIAYLFESDGGGLILGITSAIAGGVISAVLLADLPDLQSQPLSLGYNFLSRILELNGMLKQLIVFHTLPKNPLSPPALWCWGIF